MCVWEVGMGRGVKGCVGVSEERVDKERSNEVRCVCVCEGCRVWRVCVCVCVYLLVGGREGKREGVSALV